MNNLHSSVIKQFHYKPMGNDFYFVRMLRHIKQTGRPSLFGNVLSICHYKKLIMVKKLFTYNIFSTTDLVVRPSKRAGVFQNQYEIAAYKTVEVAKHIFSYVSFSSKNRKLTMW